MFKNFGCGTPDHQHELWEIELPPPLPLNEISKEPINDKNDDEPLKVLLLTDLHIDPFYAIGSPTKCKEPMCCRNDSTPIHSIVSSFFYNIKM